MSNLMLYEELAKQDAMSAIVKLGEVFARSGMFGITKPEQGHVMAMTCIIENMTPVEFFRRYHVIEGKLAMKADAMLARFQELGGRVSWLEFGKKACRARWSYCGNDIIVDFTIADAAQAGLCGPDGTRKPGQDKDGNWQKYPDAMLRARCVSKAIRMLAPQVNAGMYTPEEEEDNDRQRVGPLPPRQAPPEEPKEVGAMVIGDAPAPTVPESSDNNAEAVEAILSANEESVNAYFVDTKWISQGQTWRDLKDDHRRRVYAKPEAVVANAKRRSELLKEPANA